MNGLTKIALELNAIHVEVSELLATPMRIEETVEQRLDRARAEMIERMGGVEAMQRMHEMATTDLYASGRHLD